MNSTHKVSNHNIYHLLTTGSSHDSVQRNNNSGSINDQTNQTLNTSEQGQASQITNFFAVRKRKSSEQQSSLLRGKKSRANQNQDAEDNFSDQVVPDISLVDNKENGDFSASDSSSASSCDEYTFSSAWRNAIQLIPNVTVSTPRGIFEMLPPELLCEAFNYIPASQLIKLSLSSATLNIQIQEYVKLSSVHRRFREEISTKHKVLYKPDHDPFYDWGTLLKTCTISLNLEDRCTFLGQFFTKNSTVHDWYGWGRCFMAFCQRWTFEECENLFRSLMFFTGVNDILNQVVPAQIENAHLEIEARERLKGFFMSHKGHDNRYGFWNSLILRTQESLAAQGRLFMIIFGPVKTNSQNKVIDWELLANETIESHIMCEEVIGPLSFSLNSMISDVNLGNYAWSDHSIFNLLEEITTVPNSWTLDNFASLLILKPRLMYIALQFRITYNLVNEAADLFHTINSVLHHWGVFYIEAVASVILQIFRSLSSSQRRQFLSSYLMIEAQSLQEALTTNPFDRDCFYVEMAIRRAVSPFILLLATSI